MIAVQYAAFLFFPMAMAYAAASDLLSMTISNRVSILLIGGFVVLAPFLPGMDLQTFGWHLVPAIIVLIVTFIMFGFGWIGGGDAKIAAAATLWMGHLHAIEYMLWTALFGGVVTFAILIMRQRIPLALAVRYTWLYRLHDHNSGVPYGLALAAAALLVYPQTIWIGFVAG